MTTTVDPMQQAERARQTIWRQFEQRRVNANVATARLLLVDLAVHGRANRRTSRGDRTARAPGNTTARG
jgi:hypothetical protein